MRCKENHRQNYYSKDSLQRQIHVPLLIRHSNEQQQHNNLPNTENRNKTNNIADDFLEPSIILELEKDNMCDYNIIKNINKGDEKSYDDIKFT